MALLGLCVGSFVATLARRVPEDWRGILRGRSTCPNCGTVLGAKELVPLGSYLSQRGRCRHCSTPIAPYYPLVELACAAVAIMAAIQDRPEAALLGWWLLALALIDLRTGLLPDALTLPLLLVGLFFHPHLGHALTALGAWAALAAIAQLYPRLRGREGLGLGDAKLLGAGGAWLGWELIPWALALGALLTLGAAILAGRRLSSDLAVPFGPGLAAAVWLLYLTTDIP